MLSPAAPQAQVAETERDGVLRVLVVGHDGRPLAGAQVRLFWEREQQYFDAGQGATDDAGQATLGRVPAARFGCWPTPKATRARRRN